MSDTMSTLVQALRSQQPQQPAGSQMPQPHAAVPLASMVDRLAPNAAQLQQQNPQLPWWGVPGMFKAGPGAFGAPQAPAAPAMPGGGLTMEMLEKAMQDEQLRKMLMMQFQGVNNESESSNGGSAAEVGGGSAGEA